jgi:superfamily II DNA or RNA helicase
MPALRLGTPLAKNLNGASQLRNAVQNPVRSAPIIFCGGVSACKTRSMIQLTPVLTPHGALTLIEAGDGCILDGDRIARLQRAFARGSGHGLLSLGVDDAGAVLPSAFSWWRDFGGRFAAALCATQTREENSAAVRPPAPDSAELTRLADTPPIMTGAEYLTAEVLTFLWRDMGQAFTSELAEAGCPLQEFLKRRNPVWNLVGRVHFNLAENRQDQEAPFAFLATYTPRLSAQAKAQHLPLGEALKEYAGAANKDGLLSLLTPVQTAAASCRWLKAMVDDGEIYYPLRWTAAEALQFLDDVPALESAGVIVRTPANWRMNRPPRPKVKASVGGTEPSFVGAEALLNFNLQVTLDGETLTEKEIREILRGSDGLALVRGKWVEIDRERLQKTLAQFEAIESRAKADGLTFAEAMRLLAGASVTDGADDAARGGWGEIAAGPWLAETLKAMRQPGGRTGADPGESLRGTLRPYQRSGVEWLHLLTRLGLGACLADDMGLGKTIQVLSLLLVLKREAQQPAKSKNVKGEAGPPGPSLLIAPASLLANWAGEIVKFAPDVKALVAHLSAMPAGDLKKLASGNLTGTDLVITSYGSVIRLPWLNEVNWHLVILDEAQSIKNPDAKQTKAVKRLKARSRVALTGTPIENRLTDLWSLFDFINPSLLGTAKQFAQFVKRLEERPHNPHGPLRDLVRPYILRRLKTDKSIIADLPDKTELKAYCPLSRKQAALYQQAVADLAERLETADNIARRGVILAALMRFKQICNHPSQWLGDGGWAEEDSGKLARLRDIAEVIASRQEKVLVFTQFKETTAPLEAFLGRVFGRSGLILHGGTEVKKRKELVKLFQEDESVPFFILSLKAGGTGLNLTAASHVIHFDRWWNPAIENQASDRAFRIGQTRNVLVHKFVCRGTVEDKIDQMIESKSRLAGDFLEGGAEVRLTEMDDEALLKIVALDLAVAAREG